MSTHVLKNWETKPLGNLLDVQNGYAFPSDAFSKTVGIPLIRIRDLKNGRETEIRFDSEYEKKFVVHSGDFLISMDGEFRCYQWKGPDSLLNQRVCRLTDFSKDVLPEFVFYGINFHLKVIEDNTPYVTVRHLSAKKIKLIKFSYPSISEQRRIIARVKGCIERLEEIEQLRIKAISEADAMLPSMFNEVFASLSDTYEKIEIGDVALETRYGTSRKCSIEPKGTPVLRIPNVAEGFVNFENLKYCLLDEKELRKIALQKGDLLFVRTNGSRHLVGRCAIYEGNSDERDYGFASYLIRVRLDQKQIRPHFLAYFLNSTHGRAELDKRRRTSAGQYNINSENLRNIEVPLPPVDVQDRLNEILSDRQSQVVRLQNYLLNAQNTESHIRKSILHGAFAGEL